MPDAIRREGAVSEPVIEVEDLSKQSQMYPESIHRGPMRVLIYVGIPVGFYSHVPVRMLRAPDPLLIAGCLAMAALLARLAWLAFRSGLRRYESGNLIGSRM